MFGEVRRVGRKFLLRGLRNYQRRQRRRLTTGATTAVTPRKRRGHVSLSIPRTSALLFHHTKNDDNSSDSSRNSSDTVDFDNGKEWLKSLSFYEVSKRAILFKIISYPRIARYLIAIQAAALNVDRSKQETPSFWQRTVNGLTHSIVFPTFCGGDSVQSCMESTRMFWDYPTPNSRLEIILDQSTEEQTGGNAAFDANCDTKIRVIKEIAVQSRAIQKQSMVGTTAADSDSNSDDEEEEGSPPPPVVRVNALKLTALMDCEMLGRMTTVINREYPGQGGGDPRPFMTADDLSNLDTALERCGRIIDTAVEENVSLFVDAEQVTRNPGINFISRELQRQYHSKLGYPVLYNTYQLYLKESAQWIDYDLTYARREGFTYGIKIVRGAYMKQEKEWAHQRGDPDPICDGIDATHEQYNSILKRILSEYAANKVLDLDNDTTESNNHLEREFEKNPPTLALAVCTHNRRSLEILDEECQRLKINPAMEPYLLTGQLLGMCDHLAFAMKSRGFRAFKLAVFGQFEDVWPYLMRRLDENAEMLAATTNENGVFARETRRRLGLPF